MPCHRCNSSSRLGAAFLLALLISSVCSLAHVPLASAREPAGPPRFQRPDPETIRAEGKDILSHRRFATRRNLLQRIRQWLAEKLARLRLPSLGLGSGLGRVVWWIIIIWCVLTLVAIIGHIVWTLATFVRGTRGSRLGLKRPHFERLRERSFKELTEMMRELAQQGKFREAIGVMMIALVRWLDGADVLKFHQSKTNGDYVREYPAARAGRGEFRRFALIFDGTIYGGSKCDSKEYRRMNNMFEQVLDHAGQKP